MHIFSRNRPNEDISVALAARESVARAWRDWRAVSPEYVPAWKRVGRSWVRCGDDAAHLDAALAYLLALARVNPALPPRARSMQHALSKIAACAVFLRTLREMSDAHARWARVLLDNSSAVYDALLDNASEITREIAARVIGSRRRHARDGGGHWHAVVDRLARGWISDTRAHEVERAEIALWAFPRTVATITQLVRACTPKQVDDAFAHAVEACEEWLLDDAMPAPESGDGGNSGDGEDAQIERVFAEDVE